MAVPFRRTSKTKKRMRRTHFKLAIEGVATCAKCGAMIKSHRVCAKCGYYDGKLVVDVEGKKAPVVEEKKAKKAPKAKKEKAVKEEKAPKAKKAVKAKKEDVKVEE